MSNPLKEKEEALERHLAIVIITTCLVWMPILLLGLGKWTWLDTDRGATISLGLSLSTTAIFYGTIIYSLISANHITIAVSIGTFVILNYLSLIYLLTSDIDV